MGTIATFDFNPTLSRDTIVISAIGTTVKGKAFVSSVYNKYRGGITWQRFDNLSQRVLESTDFFGFFLSFEENQLLVGAINRILNNVENQGID